MFKIFCTFLILVSLANSQFDLSSMGGGGLGSIGQLGDGAGGISSLASMTGGASPFGGLDKFVANGGINGPSERKQISLLTFKNKPLCLSDTEGTYSRRVTKVFDPSSDSS